MDSLTVDWDSCLYEHDFDYDDDVKTEEDDEDGDYDSDGDDEDGYYDSDGDDEDGYYDSDGDEEEDDEDGDYDSDDYDDEEDDEDGDYDFDDYDDEEYDEDGDYDSDDDDDEEEEEEEIKEKWVEHYSSSQSILLVGEGDYSFSLCLAKAFTSAHNIVATSLDSLKDLGNKYSHGVRNVRELVEMGGLVLCGLDAICMRDHHFLTTQRFDRIVYNFPHVGFRFPEANSCQIKMNKELVKGFLKNAKGLLKEDVGEIHVAHKDGYPYYRWNLVKKAQKIGLVLHEKIPFHKHKYPGYYNKRGYGKRSNDPFPLGDCTTYKFKLPH